jgi:hypothetical protein
MLERTREIICHKLLYTSLAPWLNGLGFWLDRWITSDRS